MSLFLGYFIGSFPSGYLLVKWKSRLDIRKAGTGNVGTMNVLDVTGSKPLALAVLAIDLSKGILAAAAALLITGYQFWYLSSAGIGAVLGHSFPVWLKFRGGRGLAASAGVMLVLGWIFVVLWLMVWILMYMVAKNIHIANVSASILGPSVLFLLPDRFLQSFLSSSTMIADVRILALALCLIILIRHKDPIMVLWRLFRKTQTS